jgi:predicted CopG family antitoxin
MSEEFVYPKLRKLKRKDRKKFGALIVQLQEKTGNKSLTEMIPSAPKEGEGDEEMVNTAARIAEMALGLLSTLLQYLDEEMGVWFMSILSIEDEDEFDDMPFDIEVYVIEELLGAKEFTNFFARGSRLYKRISGSAGQ